MRTTLKDIALHAGVSPALVSNYLNGNQAARMSENTRKRIEKALHELDYHASWAARALRTGKSNIIGLVGTMLNYEVSQSEMIALFNEASLRGFQLSVQYSGEDPVQLKNAVQSLLGQGCDLVIISGNITQSQCDDLQPFYSRIVLLNSNKSAGIPGRTVRYDYEDAVLTALTDLKKSGHDNVCYLCDSSWRIDQRMSAFLAIYPEANIVDCNLYSKRGSGWFAKLLEEHPDCTAFFCINDLIALELMQYLILNGRQVPEDYSVLGFDDIQAAALAVPPLSSIAKPLQDAARCTLDLCQRILKDHSAGQDDKIFKCIYVPRSSVSKAAR